MWMGWQSHLSTLPLVENEAVPLAPPPLEKGRSVREADRVGIAFAPGIDPHPPRPVMTGLGDLPFSRLRDSRISSSSLLAGLHQLTLDDSAGTEKLSDDLQ